MPGADFRGHTYLARVEWSGSTGAGYRAYPRAHTAWTPPATEGFDLSADPHFRGDADLPNPEQLLVLAASSCQLLSFLAVAARGGVDVRRLRGRRDGGDARRPGAAADHPHRAAAAGARSPRARTSRRSSGCCTRPTSSATSRTRSPPTSWWSRPSRSLPADGLALSGGCRCRPVRSSDEVRLRGPVRRSARVRGGGSPRVSSTAGTPSSPGRASTASTPGSPWPPRRCRPPASGWARCSRPPHGTDPGTSPRWWVGRPAQRRTGRDVGRARCAALGLDPVRARRGSRRAGPQARRVAGGLPRAVVGRAVQLRRHLLPGRPRGWRRATGARAPAPAPAPTGVGGRGLPARAGPAAVAGARRAVAGRAADGRRARCQAGQPAPHPRLRRRGARRSCAGCARTPGCRGRATTS